VRTKKRNLVVVICLLQFLSSSSFSQLAPFYPLKAKEKGVSTFAIGVVLGVMAIT
jgi:hypothetical protein